MRLASQGRIVRSLREDGKGQCNVMSLRQRTNPRKLIGWYRPLGHWQLMWAALSLSAFAGAVLAGTPPLPVIPGTNFVVTAFGAVGDGLTNNATAIQNTINAAAAAGGGTVEIPANGTLSTYLSGPINLASSINLQIDGGAMLKMLPHSAVTNGAVVIPKWPDASTPFIDGATLTDAEISGPGTIDGQGTNWWFPLASTRPNFIEFDHCTRVLIQNVTLQNPPTFHIYLKNSDTSVTIQGITINTPFDSHNTDGADISSTNVLIQNCFISTGDDNLEIGGSGAPATDITVSNCTFGTGHGLSMGSKIGGGVNNLIVSNCSWNGTEYGIKIKSDLGSGGLVQNIKYCDLAMTNVNIPIAFYMDYNALGSPTKSITITPANAAADTAVPLTNTTPIYENINISDLTAVGNGGIQGPGNIAGIIYGRPESPVTNVTLCRVNILGRTKDGTFCVYHARDIRIIDSNLTAPSSGTNTLTLYNAEITVTNSAASTNLVTLGGLGTPSNTVLAFFNAQGAVTDTNLPGAGSITLGSGSVTFTQDSVRVTNNLIISPDPGGASTLTFTTGTNSFAGTVSGDGSLTLNMTGGSILSFSGNTLGFNGTLTASNGTLLVNNGSGGGTEVGTITVADGATVGGNGVIAGPLTVNGTFAPGNEGAGTLTVSNDVTLASGATVSYALGTSSSLAVVSGNLTLNGTLDVTDAGGFAPGTYTLFQYGGELITNGTPSILAVGSVPEPHAGYIVGISSNGYVTLTITPPVCTNTLSSNGASFDLAGGSNTVTVTSSDPSCSWSAASNIGWIQIAGGNLATSGTAVVAYSVLPYTTGSVSRTGTLTVAGQTFTVIQSGDISPPTTTINTTPSGIVSGTITLSGTATDNVGVTRLDLYRDDDVLLASTVATSYQMALDTTTLADGRHCFFAWAYDPAGNIGASTSSCVIVDNNPPSVPSGLVATPVSTNEIVLDWTPSTDAGSGVAGYQVVRDNLLFVNTTMSTFSDSGLATASRHCYTVTAVDLLGHTSATAGICTQTLGPASSMQGTYNGLITQPIAPSFADSGSIRIIVSKSTSFGATLTMGSVHASFHGKFDPSGNSTNVISLLGVNSVVALHGSPDGTDQITGTVSNADFVSGVLADRETFSSRNPCPVAGGFTMVFSPPSTNDSSLPEGFGFSTLAVTPSGFGHMRGVLGDGTRIAVLAPVSKHGTIPLYVPLYGRQGAALGWLTFVNTNTAIQAVVDWFRPAIPNAALYPDGFATNVTLSGQSYVSPAKNGPGLAGTRQVTLDGGNLITSIVETAVVSATGAVSVSGPNAVNLQMKIDLTSGLFSGSFTHPVLNKTINFSGLFLQTDESGAGLFLGSDQTGSVVLEPAE